MCNSLKLDSCACKTKNVSVCSTLSTTQLSTSSVENSVETTSLSDLPGKYQMNFLKSNFASSSYNPINLAIIFDNVGRLKCYLNASQNLQEIM